MLYCDVDPTGEVKYYQEKKFIDWVSFTERHISISLTKDNNLLLQRRSDSADHYTGVFTISVTDHVDAWSK